MKSGKNRMNNKIRCFLLLCLVLIVCGTVGGTLALLHMRTDSITNTFDAAQFTYILNLKGNPGQASNDNSTYTDEDITLPTYTNPVTTNRLTADFPLSGTTPPALEGYLFTGWYYDAACTEAEEYPDYTDNNITVDYYDTHDKQVDDKTVVEIDLYADWEPITYTVYYDGNGSDDGTTTDKSTHTYDVRAPLTENGYTKTGYTFQGWDKESGATKVDYADKAEVINLANVQGAEVTLYAVWNPITYKVYYDGNGADNPTAMTFSEHTYDVPSNLTANAFEKNGYAFRGWSTTVDGEVVYENEAEILNLLNEDGTEITLYAVWEQMDFTVSFDTQVDDVRDPDPIKVTFGQKYGMHNNGELPIPEYKGYTFLGWTLTPVGNEYITADSIVNIAADHTLYAQWDAKTYLIRYHANGGEGTMEDQQIKYDVPTPLNKNEFTKGDYHFIGWALTPGGEVEYIDEQIVVNLLESGILDLYAVWAQDTHTVYFDYNGGTGSPDSKQFQNGKAYGQLPEYPVHRTKEISDTEVMSYLFTGWYTEPTGGTRVYPTDIANTTEDHTLYAQWKDAPTNNVIKDIVVKNNPDDDKDGVVDDVYLNLKCSSSFEKFNVPLENLVIGQTYRLTYTASNDASFGDYLSGYKNSVYGSYIVDTKELTGGRIDTQGTLGVDYFGMDLLATWYDRIEPDGTHHDGSHEATNDEYLNGPWKNRIIEFTATDNTMYWTWDFGLMQDGILDNYNITDIVLEPVVPTIEFGNKKLIIHNTSKAKVLNDNSSAYESSFTFDGDGYAETMYYPITGLTAGTTYTITFDHSIEGALINNTSYDYGCGISSVVPEKYGSFMKDLGAVWISTKQPVFTKLKTTESVTLTFTATGNTAYWVWNMANCSDSTDCPISIKVTKFSAQHNNGGQFTYYEETSSAAVMYAANPYEDAVPTVELPENTFEGQTYSFMTMPEDSVMEADIYLLTESEQSYAEEQGWTFYGWLLNDGMETKIFTSDLLVDLDEAMFWFFLDNEGSELCLTPLYEEAVEETPEDAEDTEEEGEITFEDEINENEDNTEDTSSDNPVENESDGENVVEVGDEIIIIDDENNEDDQNGDSSDGISDEGVEENKEGEENV